MAPDAENTQAAQCADADQDPIVDVPAGLVEAAEAADGQNLALEAAPAPQGKGETAGPNVRQLLRMNVPVIVKVAEKKMRLKDVIKWNLGSIIVFEKDAYHNIDLMVNNATIGLGQPVKIGEKFGLKITQINDPADTIRSLGQAPV